jgi:hypothetical protein
MSLISSYVTHFRLAIDGRGDWVSGGWGILLVGWVKSPEYQKKGFIATSP